MAVRPLQGRLVYQIVMKTSNTDAQVTEEERWGAPTIYHTVHVLVPCQRDQQCRIHIDWIPTPWSICIKVVILAKAHLVS